MINLISDKKMNVPLIKSPILKVQVQGSSIWCIPDETNWKSSRKMLRLTSKVAILDEITRLENEYEKHCTGIHRNMEECKITIRNFNFLNPSHMPMSDIYLVLNFGFCEFSDPQL